MVALLVHTQNVPALLKVFEDSTVSNHDIQVTEAHYAEKLHVVVSE